MAHKILLFRNNERILGTSGAMNIDGRYHLASIRHEIRNRNKSVQKNFPHHVADAFVICTDRWEYNENNIKHL